MTTFDLPFQWEDDEGKFVAPFVRTKDEELSNVIAVIEKEGLGPGDKFVEAGCGDGHVLFAVAEYFLSKKKHDDDDVDKESSSSSSTAGAVQLVGVDLDDALIDTANAESKKRIPPSSSDSSVSVSFLHSDLRDCMHSQLTNATMVFFYLLPGDGLNEIVKEMTAHWFRGGDDEDKDKKKNLRSIISMQWEVPMLRPFLVEKVGEVWYYRKNK